MENLFKKCKNDIDKRINEQLDKQMNKYKDNDFIIDSLKELKRLSQGGKRIRGFLVKVGQLLNGVDDESYLDLAVALEIFQTAVLIHDDIIDKAKMRRNMETITHKYPNHLGLSKAICIGDLGFFLAYQIINETNFKKAIKTKILTTFTDTIYNTVIGEIIDVELPYKNKCYHQEMSENIIYDIYINKTAWYTIIGPLLMGGITADISLAREKEIREIGKNLGIAFQIKDDLLGLYSDHLQMGKTLNDIKEGKQTIIYKYAIDNAFQKDREFIYQNYGNPLISESDSKKILKLFDKLKAKEYAFNTLKKYTEKSIMQINNSSLKNKDILIQFANYLLERNK